MLKARHQKGATLIETMVALFILAVGLLGYAGLLTSTMTLDQRAFTLSKAIFLGENIVDKMRANRLVAGDYGIKMSATPSASVDCSSTACTQAQMVDWDLTQRMTEVQSSLPGSDGEIVTSVNSAGIVEVTVTLNYQLREGREGTGNSSILGNLETYSVSTEI